MRKFSIYFVFLLIIFLSNALMASELPPNFDELTESSKIVVVGECVAVSEGDLKVTKVFGKTIKRRLMDYVLNVSEIIKDETGELKKGEKFSFNSYLPINEESPLQVGEVNMLFLRQYLKSGTWGFVGGVDIGIFKVQEDEKGEKIIENRIKNRGLTVGLKEEIAGTKANALGLKEISKDDAKVLEQDKGPIKLNNVIDIVTRIKTIQFLREKIYKEKIKEDSLKYKKIEGTKNED